MSNETPDTSNPDIDAAAQSESAELRNEILHADEYSEYLLHQPREVLSILEQVVDAGDLITVYFNEGKDFLLTSLLAADENGVRIDKGSNSVMNQRALAANKLFCVTRHAKVKLQFLLTGLSEVNHEGQKVFAAALPATLLRLQRREYFRLNAPIARPLICHIPVRRPDGSSDRIAVTIVDISAGGVAMLAPPDGLVFEQDMEFQDCSIELPELGVLTSHLRVRNVYEVVGRSGARIKRSGCQFINLSPAGQNLIQRYIIKIERERKARDSGLA